LPTGEVPGQSPEDAELVHAIADGSSEALGSLYDRHAPAILGLCLRILGVRADAEEVLSDVFLQVWDQAERYEPSRGKCRGLAADARAPAARSTG
jgi:RNA polymerase sigma-70 factor (ECF subfamily)